ncbi:hypothetical protein AVEN_122184-1 [Araneus ventricosus]|uniref:Uncharacterized protein n=1 Tax=Araneus ventricosus TaxID=182803 RepID=A0A4Y2IIK8_ARAVE|nr:hypothetical protein AVEN_122184-1 [Araneus ventricosus]
MPTAAQIIMSPIKCRKSAIGVSKGRDLDKTGLLLVCTKRRFTKASLFLCVKANDRIGIMQTMKMMIMVTDVQRRILPIRAEGMSWFEETSSPPTKLLRSQLIPSHVQ